MRPPLFAEVRGFIFSLDYYIEGFDLPPFVFVKQLVLFQKLKVLTYGGKTDDHTVIALFSNLKNRGHGSRDDPEEREESLGRMEHSCSHNLQSLTHSKRSLSSSRPAENAHPASSSSSSYGSLTFSPTGQQTTPSVKSQTLKTKKTVIKDGHCVHCSRR